MSKYEIELCNKSPSYAQKEMERGFNEYDKEHGTICDFKKFSLIMKGEDGSILGALNANTVYAEIYVEDLWVSKEHRGKGYGSALLKELENRFEGLGYNNINLVTSAFQAPDFYKKCGYIAEFTRPNLTNPQFTKTYFVKYFHNKDQTKGLLNPH